MMWTVSFFIHKFTVLYMTSTYSTCGTIVSVYAKRSNFVPILTAMKRYYLMLVLFLLLLLLLLHFRRKLSKCNTTFAHFIEQKEENYNYFFEYRELANVVHFWWLLDCKRWDVILSYSILSISCICDLNVHCALL